MPQMNVFHAKENSYGREVTHDLHLNSAVGKLFSTGMGQQDQKEMLEPANRSQPHRSQASFNEKKTKHATGHHMTPRAELIKQPSPFLKSTFNSSGGFQSSRNGRSTTSSPRGAQQGRRGGRGDLSSRSGRPTTPGSRASDVQPKYVSHSELSLDKRRHQAKYDDKMQTTSGAVGDYWAKGATGAIGDYWANNPRSPRSPVTGLMKPQRTPTRRGAPGGYPESASGSSVADSCRTPVAGLMTPGFQDLCQMEPVAGHQPHTSIQEFNMKKAQHFTGLHKSGSLRR